jgi:hypothetical protein
LDPAISNGRATLLAAMGSRSTHDHENSRQIVFLRGRAIDGANSFMTDLQLSLDGMTSPRNVCPSELLDMTRRRLRLLTWCNQALKECQEKEQCLIAEKVQYAFAHTVSCIST